MAAAITALACIALTIIMGTSANSKMNEISNIFIAYDDTDTIESLPPDSIDSIDILPEYLDKLEDSKQTFHAQSLLAMLGIILASSLLTYFIAGKCLRQLKTFSKKVEEIQVQNLSAPLDFADLPTELQRLSLSFNNMLKRLEQSFSAQKQFSANAAHELRTPLAVIQTKIDVFQKNDAHTTEEYQEVLTMLAAQVERLSAIINELLEMTNLQTARRTDTISLSELTEEVLCDFYCQAQSKEITLIQEGEDVKLTGNETLIYRAVFNLVENAIKYNHPGGKVTVTVSSCTLPAHAGLGAAASVTVTDTGMGIPKEYHTCVFEPFFRVDKSRSREMGGAGIGLAMVKMIAELHGGTVRIESSSLNGSSIRMDFPIH